LTGTAYRVGFKLTGLVYYVNYRIRWSKWVPFRAFSYPSLSLKATLYTIVLRKYFLSIREYFQEAGEVLQTALNFLAQIGNTKFAKGG